MGASAGTGVRSFAEGGSTSSSSETSAMNFGPIGESVARGLANPALYYPQNSGPSLGGQRQIYQAQYEDYGLGSTPQAQGRLASILNMGNYGNQMPTFTRPQAPPPQAQYSIPYRTTPDSSFSGLLPKVVKSLGLGKSLTPERQAANLIKDYREGNFTEAQYNKIMKNPAMYSDFFRRLDVGENPTTIGYGTPPPVQYMTAAQQKAYNDKITKQLDELIRPRTVFEVQDYGGA